jgi:hypothetical protein
MPRRRLEEIGLSGSPPNIRSGLSDSLMRSGGAGSLVRPCGVGPLATR